MPPSSPARVVKATPLRLFRAALAVSLTVSALLYFLWSWRWPLVGDASLIHYIGFLIQRGWAPYRQLGDMNMPGSYLIEIAAMHVFGMGDLAWRLFDFTLLILASAAFFVVTRSPGAPFVTASSSRVGSDNRSPGAPSFRLCEGWYPRMDGWPASSPRASSSSSTAATASPKADSATSPWPSSSSPRRHSFSSLCAEMRAGPRQPSACFPASPSPSNRPPCS